MSNIQSSHVRVGVGVGLGDFVGGCFVVVAPNLVEVGLAQAGFVTLVVVTVVMQFAYQVERKGG